LLSGGGIAVAKIDKYINTIICGDCLEVMKEFPDNSVDLVLTDPPYVGLKGGMKHFGGQGVCEISHPSYTIGDLWSANFQWISNAWRICDKGLMSFSSFHNIDRYRDYLPDEKKVALLTWDKITSPTPVGNVPRFSSEFIWCYRKNPSLEWWRLKSTVLRVVHITAGCVSTGERMIKTNSKQALHPAQKPLRLILKLLAIGGDVVLDPFCGLGTTCVAAKMLGRRYIGIDISPEYCEIARMRLKAVETGVSVKEQKQGQLSLLE
jgi:site-specific DNA-methyltransferase (adenine-specific)